MFTGAALPGPFKDNNRTNNIAGGFKELWLVIVANICEFDVTITVKHLKRGQYLQKYKLTQLTPQKAIIVFSLSFVHHHHHC